MMMVFAAYGVQRLEIGGGNGMLMNFYCFCFILVISNLIVNYHCVVNLKLYHYYYFFKAIFQLICRILY